MSNLTAHVRVLSEKGRRGEGEVVIENWSSKPCVLPKLLDGTFINVGKTNNDVDLQTSPAQEAITLKSATSTAARFTYVVDPEHSPVRGGVLAFGKASFVSAPRTGRNMFMGDGPVDIEPFRPCDIPPGSPSTCDK
ncbi:hypothetical protein ACGFT2_23705 [Streptomyces sp. NPDC048514]|uniref:hypothetical protein n=1 Tax=Streptomyces sp. NPDC048514 TaxID=3365564 RepID=UPI00371DB3AE